MTSGIPLVVAAMLLSVDAVHAQQQPATLVFDFHGDSALTQSALRACVSEAGLTTPRPDAATRISQVLQDAYARRGYAFARVDSVAFDTVASRNTIIARVSLSEGPCVFVGRVALEGVNAWSQGTAWEGMQTITGAPFVDATLRDDMSRLLHRYDKAGYPFASIIPESIVMRDSASKVFADITVRVHEEKRFTIGEINVEGNTTTSPEVIIRETRLRRGELYDPDKIALVRQRLERLGFFSKVSEPELYLRDTVGGITLRVAEGNTNLFDGIIGYQPPKGTEAAGTVTGLVNVSFRNIFGSGRRFDGRWEHASQSLSVLELRYIEPWIFGMPLNVEGGLRQRQQDSAYVRRTLDARATFLATSAVQVSAGVQQTGVIPSAGSTDLAASTATGGSLELVIDTRDDLFAPTAGVRFRNLYEGSSKRFSHPETGDRTASYLQRIELDVTYHVEMFPRNVAVMSLHGRELRGADIDASDLYHLGGATTLRGYREEQFSGSRLAWSSVEYRYLLGRRSFAFAFFDFGYMYRPALPPGFPDVFTAWRNGYGIGAHIETALGIVGVSYALGQGDTFSSGKVHFGLINEF